MFKFKRDLNSFKRDVFISIRAVTVIFFTNNFSNGVKFLVIDDTSDGAGEDNPKLNVIDFFNEFFET